MGIRMNITDTDAVTTDDLLSQLPHSKFAKEVKALRSDIAKLHDIAGSYSSQIVTLTAERDLFKKETAALASDSLRYQSALDQIASSIPAARQNTPVSYLQGIAKEALEI